MLTKSPYYRVTNSIFSNFLDSQAVPHNIQTYCIRTPDRMDKDYHTFEDLVVNLTIIKKRSLQIPIQRCR